MDGALGGGAMRRLLREYEQIVRNPLPGVTVCIASESEMHGDEWIVSLKGVEGTPYEEGLFSFKMWFTKYPFKPPLLSFMTDIYHCNLSAAVTPNQINVNYLYEEPDIWKPSMRVRDVIARVQTLMVEPYSTPGEVDDDVWLSASPGGCSGGVHGDEFTEEIFVKMLDGTTLSIHVAPTDLIINLRCEIQARTGVPITENALLFAGKRLLNKKSILDYNLQEGSTVHMVGGPARLHNLQCLMNTDLAELLRSDREVYEQRARDHTRCKALDPERGPLVTVGLVNGAVQCTLLSGEGVTELEIPSQETVGSLRLLIASQLKVPGAALKLVSQTANDLTQTADEVPLLEALSLPS